MNEKQGFVLYRSFYKPTKGLPERDKAALFDAIFLYHENKAIPELSPAANMALEFMTNQFELDKQKYIKRCEKNRENVNKRWNADNTNEYNRIQSNKNNTKHTDKEKEKEKEKDKDLKKNIKKKFSKPTILEIKEYCKERKNNIDPEQFYDHYEAKGWKVGKTSMSDWKAAVRTWEKNNTQQGCTIMPKIEEFGGIYAN